MSALAGTPCLVLGAGGFIGTHLCRALHQAGARVHGFGHPPGEAAALAGIAFTPGELGDHAALVRALEGAAVVFHLIGSTLPAASNEGPLADIEASVTASLRLLDLCRQAGVQRVVFASSGGTVYGIPRTIPLDEGARTDPITAYGIHKLMIEKWLQLHGRLGGPRGVSLRIANPFGPFQRPERGQGLVSAVIARVLQGAPIEIWGDGSIVRDYLYVGDVAQAALAAAGYEGGETVFNIGSGIGRTVLDVVDGVCAALDRPPPPLVFRPARAADVPVNVLEIGLARRELGWQPSTPFAEAVRETARWIAALG